MPRVLSSDVAEQAITQMQSIITGGLNDQIRQLEGVGQQLSDPNNWDGNLAHSFRGDIWPRTKSALDQAAQQLEVLRSQLAKINADIMSAGGNG